MLVPRWSEISAVIGFSITRPMATRSTSRRAWRRPTSSWAPAFASARLWRRGRKTSAGGRSAISLLRGRSEPLRAYEPLPAAAFEAPTTKQYSEAFAKLEANDVTAMPAFAALVGQHADDALAGFHLRRLLNGGKGVRMQLE